MLSTSPSLSTVNCKLSEIVRQLFDPSVHSSVLHGLDFWKKKHGKFWLDFCCSFYLTKWNCKALTCPSSFLVPVLLSSPFFSNNRTFFSSFLSFYALPISSVSQHLPSIICFTTILSFTFSSFSFFMFQSRFVHTSYSVLLYTHNFSLHLPYYS